MTLYQIKPKYMEFLMAIYDRVGPDLPFTYSDIKSDGIWAASLHHMKQERLIVEVGTRKTSKDPSVYRLSPSVSEYISKCKATAQ